MIEHLDNLLRHLFITKVEGITEETQVRFQPPDAEWCNYVSNLTVDNDSVNALNVYLMDLRENSKFRSNARVREVQNGEVTEILAPRRIDCHYLISAWSPTENTPDVEPAVDEHALLYKVIGVLMNSIPLIPQKIYKPDPLPNTFPPEIADVELPTEVLPGEGFPKLDEFWGTMGQRWRPAVYLIVTLPVILEKQIAGPMVTTRITEYRLSGKPETTETWIQIAGTVTETVTDPNGKPVAKPVAEAWVRLETLEGVSLQTTYGDVQIKKSVIDI